jgi:cell volume regulation protein A
MGEITHFGLIVLVVSAVFALAVLANRVSEQVPIPSPAIFLLAAAIVAHFVPRLGRELSIQDVERIAVLALIVILFDGGMRVGWARFRRAVVPITTLGVLGTFATAGLMTP